MNTIKEKVNNHGVNLLLNVGPDYLGRIPAPSVPKCARAPSTREF